MLYRKLNTVGGYLSPACGGGKITSTQFFLIDKGSLQWCAKGIVIFSYPADHAVDKLDMFFHFHFFQVIDRLFAAKCK